nr:hypothetical protein GCM10020093_061410 [Planobispora longispora]
MEDLLLLGALDGKIVIGSMNRGGVHGTVFEFDDRFTAYDAATIARMGLDGGKMLCRIGVDEPATAATLESCARAVSELAARGLTAMVEPFWSRRVDGTVTHDLSPEGVIRAVHVGQGLGATSAHTWLKIPVVDEMERVMAATTLPTLLLGGDPGDTPDLAYAAWRKALRLPGVRGLWSAARCCTPPMTMWRRRWTPRRRCWRRHEATITSARRGRARSGRAAVRERRRAAVRVERRITLRRGDRVAIRAERRITLRRGHRVVRRGGTMTFIPAGSTALSPWALWITPSRPAGHTPVSASSTCPARPSSSPPATRRCSSCRCPARARSSATGYG